MFSLISSLISYFSQMEVMIKTLVACGCLVFGGVVVNRLFRRKTRETLPDDIMEMIVPHLSVRDRINLSVVCKPWSSVPMRRDIPSSPHQLPWLVLPQPESQALTCKDSSLSFFNLHDGKLVKLDLPEPVRGGWFRGSSKGWLIMIKDCEQNSTIFLVNPISGVQHRLPSLRTIPAFQKFVETTRWKQFGAFSFYSRIVLSNSDITSDECVVAACFGCANEILGLCRPGDKAWSIFEVLDANESLTDLLFSSGKLYALVSSNSKNGVVPSPRTLNFGDHSVELKLVYNIKPIFTSSDENYDNFMIHLQGLATSHLLESTTNNEVLLIQQMLDQFLSTDENNNDENGDDGNNVDDDDDDVESNDGADEADVEGNNYLEGNGEVGGEGNAELLHADEDDGDLNPYLRTSGFKVYRLDQENGKFDRVACLGEQLLFLSLGGSLSLQASDIKESSSPQKSDTKELGGNCIYFATNIVPSFHSLETYTSREIGVFNLNNRRIQRSFPSVEVSVRSQLSWFTPIL